MLQVVVPLTHRERRALIESPIDIQHYGGRSFAGHCPIRDRDTAYSRYLRAWRKTQGASDQTADNGYLP
jgi:hypothetical protein